MRFQNETRVWSKKTAQVITTCTVHMTLLRNLFPYIPYRWCLVNLVQEKWS